MALILQTLFIFYVFVQVSSSNQNTSSDSYPSSRRDYSVGSNYYTPGVYSREKSFYNPSSARTKGETGFSTYPGSGYIHRQYNSIPAASTVYNNYKGIPQPTHGYYKGVPASDYNRHISGYLQGRVSKNNIQDNYRYSSGVQDFRSRWSHTPPVPSTHAAVNHRPYGGFVTKAGSGGYNYALLRDSRLHQGVKMGPLPAYAPATTKKTGVYVIPTPSKLYHDGVKS